MGVGSALVALLVALLQGVYGQAWEVILPRSIVGVSGSCLTVPCRFNVPSHLERDILKCSDKGKWQKGKLYNLPMHNTRSPQSGIQWGFVGDLTKKNCTTTFTGFTEKFNDEYFFRLECSERATFTFTNGVNISIRPGPPPPLLTPPAVAKLSVGAMVTLQCSVPVVCPILPPSLTWLPRDEARQERTHTHIQPDGEMTLTSTLTFPASADHHTSLITCSVSVPLTVGGGSATSTATLTLHVLYAPRFTVALLSASGPVSEGRTVTFTCWSDANPPVTRYAWYKAESGKLTRRAEGQTLILPRAGPTDRGAYLCEAQTNRGSHRSGPVYLEVIKGSECAVVFPYIMCGVLLALYILTVAVDVYKYNLLARRLKQLEQKGEHTYTALTVGSVAHDYDQLQLKPMPNPAVRNYENLPESTDNPVSNNNQSAPDGAGRISN